MWSVFLFLSSVFLCLSRKTFACLTLPPRSCTVLELLQYHPRKKPFYVSHPPVPFAMISSTTAPPLIEDDFPNDLLLKASAPHCPEYGEAHAREGCVLESKLARVASKTFSVEEVTVLQKEVDHWLTEVTTANTGHRAPIRPSPLRGPGRTCTTSPSALGRRPSRCAFALFPPLDPLC